MNNKGKERMQTYQKRHAVGLASLFVVLAGLAAPPKPTVLPLLPPTPGAAARFMPRCGVSEALEKPDALLESFETQESKYKVSNFYGKAKCTFEIRDGIASEGMRCLHVDAARALDPSVSKYFEFCLLTWDIPDGIDLSAFEAVTFRLRMQTDTVPGWWYILVSDDVAQWRAGGTIDRSRLAEWQTVRIPFRRLSWFQDGPALPEDRRKCNLSAARRISLQVSGGRQAACSFDLDEIGFARKDSAYDGIKIVKVESWPFYRIDTNAPFRAKVRLSGAADARDLKATFALVDFFGKTNLLGEADIPAGTTNAVVSADFSLPDAGFAWLTGVVTADGTPLQQYRYGFANVRGQRPGCEAANPDSIFGTWVGGPLGQMGVKWTRHILRSDTVLPSAEAFPEPPDARCVRKRPDGVENAFLCFCYTPPWLNGHRSENMGYRYAPTDMDRYADWISYLVKANASQGYRLYEIWNEPVPYAGWMGSVESLVKTAEATWKGVKRVQPEAKILGPCPYSFCPEFMEAFFAKGGTNWIDDVVIHAYHAPPPDVGFVDGVRATKRLMAKYGLADRKLYITEVGYDAPGTDVRDIASFLPRVYAYALSEGVSVVIWHMAQSYVPRLNESPLLQRDGAPNPSFAAYCTMMHVLERAKYVGIAPGLSATQVGFDFARNDGVRVRMLWDKAAARGARGTPYEMAVGRAARVIDVMGGARRLPADSEGRARLGLTRDPVYVLMESGE